MIAVLILIGAILEEKLHKVGIGMNLTEAFTPNERKRIQTYWKREEMLRLFAHIIVI